jgi:hypothetical protein
MFQGKVHDNSQLILLFDLFIHFKSKFPLPQFASGQEGQGL